MRVFSHACPHHHTLHSMFKTFTNQIYTFTHTHAHAHTHTHTVHRETHADSCPPCSRKDSHTCWSRCIDHRSDTGGHSWLKARESKMCSHCSNHSFSFQASQDQAVIKRQSNDGIRSPTKATGPITHQVSFSSPLRPRRGSKLAKLDNVLASLSQVGCLILLLRVVVFYVGRMQ